MYDSDEEHGIELPGPWRGGNRDYVYDQEENYSHNDNNNGNKGKDGDYGDRYGDGAEQGQNKISNGSSNGGGVSFVGEKNYDSPNKVMIFLFLICFFLFFFN